VPDRRTRTWLAAAVLLLVAAAAWHARAELGVHLQSFALWVRGLGAWAPLAFIAGYAAAVVAFAPGLPLTLAGGAIFGPLAGILWVFAAASLGACAAFLVARYAARGLVEERLRRDPRFAAIDRAIGERGLRIAFLLRLSPVFPFNLLNYALGLTRIRFADYALACLGMLPPTIAYVYLGSLIGDVAGLGAAHTGAAEGSPWLKRGLLALGVAATFAVVAVLARTARSALAQLAREDPDRTGSV
jgi:uncharacterized membrane protein YdjX (TVP38/TMEM64 family)